MPRIIQTKDRKMVKDTEKTSSSNINPASVKNNGMGKKATTNKLTIGVVALLVVICGGGLYLMQNPHLLKTEKEKQISLKMQEIDTLKEQIQVLQNQVQMLSSANDQNLNREEWKRIERNFIDKTAELSKKVDTSLQINQEALNSKASNTAILGLVTRVDGLETRVQTLGKVSSQGALILTAAMLVKDAAASGRPFIYEAEVLRQLAMGTNMERPAEIIASLAVHGVHTSDQLVKTFKTIYDKQALLTTRKIQAEQSAGPQESRDWRKKIGEKLRQLVTIKYHGDGGKNDEKIDFSKDNASKDKVYQLVDSREFSQAMFLMATDPKYQSESFRQWQKYYKQTREFSQALNQIQALTLAFMKVENLKEESILQLP